MIEKPDIGSRIRFPQTGLETEVIEHTERGFKYKGAPSSFIPRWNLSFSGEGEIFTDSPEWSWAISNGTIVLVPEPTTIKNINRRIIAWHEQEKSLVQLHDYLGLTLEEYGHWVKTGKLL